MLQVGDYCWHRREGMNRCGKIVARGDNYVVIASPTGEDIRFKLGGCVSEFVDVPLADIWWCCGSGDPARAAMPGGTDWAERGIWGWAEPPIPAAFVP